MHTRDPRAIDVAIAAALLMALTMGVRSVFGLFVSSINTATGMGLTTISLAAAIGQLAWGAAQPIVGRIAERHGPARVITAGGVLFALGNMMIPLAGSGLALMLACTLVAVAGTAVGSSGLLLGEVSRRFPAERRGLAVGIVGAGGSAGQLVLGPATQGAIETIGWANAAFALALLALLALPLAHRFRGESSTAGSVTAGSAAPSLRGPLSSGSFWRVAAGFSMCGFHVAFLTAHMPGFIGLCGLASPLSGYWLAALGLCNIAGSVLAGMAMRRITMRAMLTTIYILRALGMAGFLCLPATPLVLLWFAAWMGLTYMATLPPTAGLIGRLFGLPRLATLLGVVMMTHQVGAFLGVWLGGLMVSRTGTYTWMWYADIVAALLAAAIHMTLREDVCVVPRRQAAA